MGGGKMDAGNSKQHQGMNMRLPDAQVAKDSAKDKMTFYAQAMNDSAKYAQQLQNDPYRVKDRKEPIGDTEENIQAIRERIQLPQHVYMPPVVEEQPLLPAPAAAATRAPDPELAAINQAIEKLAALQKPGADNTRKEVGNFRPDAAHVQPAVDNDESYFGKHKSKDSNAFFEEHGSDPGIGSMLATIPVRQVLQTGSVVKMVLNRGVTIGRNTLLAGSAVYGIASIENERLLIHVSSVRCQEAIIPVALTVYDLDGMEGIYVPGSIARDVLKSTAEHSMPSMNVLSLDPGIRTQAAIAGIGAVKSLLSQKAKVVRVTVEAGYRVFLCNTH
jgi:conjugative transposon TraM protein